MSKFGFVIAAMLAVGAVPALAQDKMIVDMRKMTCAQLTKLGFQDFAGLTMWLSGYYNASRRNMMPSSVMSRPAKSSSGSSSCMRHIRMMASDDLDRPETRALLRQARPLAGPAARGDRDVVTRVKTPSL